MVSFWGCNIVGERMTNSLPPIKLAFIIDNRVVDIINTDNRLAAIFLSDPVVIDITEMSKLENNTAFMNSTYDPSTGLFAVPEYNENGELIG